MGFETSNDFNRYTNLDNVEWRIIKHLMDSDSKHAKNLWKMLAYNEEDCLFKPDLTAGQKAALIYRDNGLSTDKKVFMTPYIDDAWDIQTSRLDVFVDRIFPTNHIQSQVNICVEVLVHNKITNIYGDAEEGNPTSNPSELSEEGDILIPSKSRATTMLKSVLAELNGSFVAGVGDLQLNSKMNAYSGVQKYVWNNHAYFGYAITFCTLMSGVSDNSDIGY